MTNSTFRMLIGNSPSARILEYFLNWEGYDVALSEITEKTNVSKNNVGPIVKKLEELAIITATRKIGKAQLYTLNIECQLVRDFKRILKTIDKQNLKEDLLTVRQ